MRLRIFKVANSYHIHAVTCTGCDAEPAEIGHPEGEAFASQAAAFLHLWGTEILARRVQADSLYLAGVHKTAELSDVTDLWTHTVFMPCATGLPMVATTQERKILDLTGAVL